MTNELWQNYEGGRTPRRRPPVKTGETKTMSTQRAIPVLSDNLYGAPQPGDGRLNQHNAPNAVDLGVQLADIQAKLKNWQDVSDNARHFLGLVNAKLAVIAEYLPISEFLEKSGLERQRESAEQDKKFHERRLEAAQVLIKRYTRELDEFPHALLLKLNKAYELDQKIRKISQGKSI